MKSELVKPTHLARKAVVYIRQSTPHQVVSNQESLRLQYALRQRARELGWHEADIDVIDAGFVPGTGWPEPGGLLPREALNLVKMVSEPGLAGLEVVECSPPYDWAEQTALLSSRVILDSLAAQVRSGKLGNKAAAQDRVAWGP